MLSRVPVRIRLAAGFATGLAVVLLLAGAFIYSEVSDNLSESVDENLSARADDARTLVEASGSNVVDLGGIREGSEETSFTQVLRADGSIVDSTLPNQAAIVSQDQVAAAFRHAVTLDGVQVRGIEGNLRVTIVPAGESQGSEVVVVGTTTASMEETLAGLRRAFVIGGPLALLLASLIGYVLGSRALSPVESMRRRAREITLDQAGDRLPTPVANDELRSLSETLNEMLDRVDEALQRERIFVSDASHELRTPLAILKSEIDLIRLTGGTKAELEAALESAAEEVNHLVRLSENLLVIARADRKSLSLRLDSVDVASLLERVHSRFEGSVNAAGRNMSVEAPDIGKFQMDGLRIEQALSNLVENALAHGKGMITLGAARSEGGLTLYVSDDGPGFPAEFREHAFERFTQAEAGRTDIGTGLGLAIVRVIAVAHGGRAELLDADRDGAEVRLYLPSNSAGL